MRTAVRAVEHTCPGNDQCRCRGAGPVFQIGVLHIHDIPVLLKQLTNHICHCPIQEALRQVWDFCGGGAAAVTSTGRKY